MLAMAGMQASQEKQGPLRGLLVVDLTRVLAGPYCTMVLGDLGARVIKIERPGSGDDARHFPPFVGNDSAYFITVNRGKESVCLDFQSPGGRDVLLRLIERADAFVENFSPGLLERYGLEPQRLLERNPRLIVARLSGYGQHGPDRDLPAYDITIQARAGLMSVTGPEDGEPVKIGSAIADIGGGLYCAIAILAALQERHQSGRGQVVDMAMLDASVSLLENSVVRRTVGGLNPRPIGQRHPSITPFDGYRCADGTIVIAAGNDDIFGRVARALGHADWVYDERYRTNMARTEHHAELKADMEAVLGREPVRHWLQVFRREQVPCAKIQSIDEVLADEQVRARKLLTTYEHKATGSRFEIVSTPFVGFSRTPGATASQAPELGQHTDAVLEELGIDAPSREQLRAAKAIG